MKDFVNKFASGAWTTALDVLRRHSLTLSTAALLGTYLAKIWWHIGSMARPGGISTPFLAFFASDLIFWGIAIAIIYLAEACLRRVWVIASTTVLAALLTIVSLANVFWLRGTGSQLTWSVIEVGFTRTAEVLPIIETGLGGTGLAMLIGAVTLVAGLPFLFRAKWRKDGRGERFRLATLGFPLVLLVLGGIGLIEQSGRNQPGWKLIAANVQVSLVRQIIERPDLPSPPVSVPDPSPPPDEPRTGASSPNVMVVVLEATAHRATSLSPRGPTNTPTLLRLARESLVADSMRAVLPHTTKSIVSIFCGCFPAMQREIMETADNYPLRCLPEIIADNGWSTAFFQSADGRFEQRPRLVGKLGFERFVAWQDLVPHSQPLGYLAGDDMALVAPVEKWIEEQEGPFFAAVLTSATHHNYELPDWLSERTGVTMKHDRTLRYAALIHGEDLMLARLVEILERRREVDGRETILVVMGDHGESFGEHGGYQHDNIFTEEGLRVPFIVHAPGLVEPELVSQPRSLLDVTPTVLDLLEIPYDPEHLDGRSLLSPDRRGRRRYFSCWYDDTCTGFVRDSEKLVLLPGARSWLHFDLEADPFENDPRIDPPDLADEVDEIRNWYNAHRYETSTLEWTKMELFDGRWICGGNERNCRWKR
ncbi:MAG: sulfatase-like hydrolase/transferase [Polyangia bacterium]